MIATVHNSLRQYRRFWISSTLLVLGTAVGIVAVVFVLGTRLDQALRRVEVVSADAMITADFALHGKPQEPARIYAALRETPGIAAVATPRFALSPKSSGLSSALTTSVELMEEVWHPPLLSGRFLSPDDSRSGLAVIVIGTTIARNWFPDREALGQSIEVRLHQQDVKLRVIGIVGVKDRITEFDDQAFIPGALDTGRLVGGFQVKAGSPDSLSERVQAGIARDLPEAGPATKQPAPLPPSSDEQTALVVFTLMSVLVLVVAGINSGNLALFWALRRRREMAIRQALGATPGSVVRMVIAELLLLNLVGAILGLAAYAAIRFFRLAPFELSFNWSHILVGLAAAVATGLIAALAPAALVARMDPTDAMRTE